MHRQLLKSIRLFNQLRERSRYARYNIRTKRYIRSGPLLRVR